MFPDARRNAPASPYPYPAIVRFWTYPADPLPAIAERSSVAPFATVTDVGLPKLGGVSAPSVPSSMLIVPANAFCVVPCARCSRPPPALVIAVTSEPIALV